MEYGLFLKKEHIFEMKTYDSPEATAIGERIANMKNKPEGIIVSTDKAAKVIMETLQKNNLRIPEDIMITGCNDTSDIPKLTVPALTTVTLPMYECGRQAALMMLDLIQGKAHPDLMLEPSLTIRQSTAAKK